MRPFTSKSIQGLQYLFFISISIVFLSSCSIARGRIVTEKEVYKSSSLVITQISPYSFVHVSFKQTTDFGNVPCNGLITRSANEVVIFDTPVNNESAKELISWVENKLKCKIVAVIPTHFHDDCLGGLKAFHESSIPSFAHQRTIILAKENNYELPTNSFDDSLTIKVGNEYIIARFFGEGHTKDNIIGFKKSEKLLFGGCLIRSLGANRGYVGDANVEEWSNTVTKIKMAYPSINVVIPGHGKPGGYKLLNYTISLYKERYSFFGIK